MISDTHLHGRSGEFNKKVRKDFSEVEMILHAGDLVSLDVLEDLRAIVPNVTAVSGNMDSAQVKNALPLKTTVEAAGSRIGLIHGHHVPQNAWLGGGRISHPVLDKYLLSEFEDVDCVVYGHTHDSRCEWVEGVLILNPGVIGGDPGTVGILRVENGINGEIIQI